ncbi:hypothetical protein BKA82DRAFT_35667 [Pisolithus tinctorius]|nr:hypothetical protein BKA82DRAFT_35667 [Pisolithus tinctorius]
MDSQYDEDNSYNDSGLTDLDDGGSIFNQGTEQSVIGDEDQESFDIDELEVLVRRQKDWKESGKMKKPMILQSILGELHKLEKNRELSHAEMQLKAGLVTSWLKKPLHAQKPHITLRSRYKYSVRSVVWELYHDRIQQKLAAMRGENEDGEGTRAIGVYQQALTSVIQEDLSDEQLAVAQDIADKWNGMEGPTPEMKARNAAKYGYKYCRNFAEEMWWYCGMRVVCVAGWKNVEGSVEACTMDFNRDIANGTAFNEIHNLEGSWWEYLGEAFEEDRISTDEDDPHTEGSPWKKMVCTIKVDPVTLVMDADGTISIPEIEGLMCDLLQKTVHGFLTAHYRQACGKATVAVPFKQLGSHQIKMIAAEYLPANFSFTGDPSHMLVSAATWLLSFWWQWQQTNPDDAFTFHKWLDRFGELHSPVDSRIHPLQIARDQRSRSQTPMATREGSKAPGQNTRPLGMAGKGKGKADAIPADIHQTDIGIVQQTSPVSHPTGRMSGSSQHHRSQINSTSNTSHRTHLVGNTIMSDTASEGEDAEDEVEQWSNGPHAATPFPRPMAVCTWPAVEHQQATHKSRKKMPLPVTLVTASHGPNADQDEEGQSKGKAWDSVDDTEELPVLARRNRGQPHCHWRDWILKRSSDIIGQIKDHSANQGNDSLHGLPLAKNASTVPDRRQLKSADGRRPSRTTQKGTTDGKSSKGMPAKTLGDGMGDAIWKSPRVRKAPARPDADVLSPPSKKSQKHNQLHPLGQLARGDGYIQRTFSTNRQSSQR